MELQETEYSDEYIAAIWLCNLIAEKRKDIIHEIHTDGHLVDPVFSYYFISKKVHDSFELCYKRYDKKHHSKIMDKFYLMVLDGEIKPQDKGIQSFSLQTFICYLKGKESVDFSGLNKKISYDCRCLARSGYSVPEERMREFYLRTLSGALTEILTPKK
jgi:hypothetical protein